MGVNDFLLKFNTVLHHKLQFVGTRICLWLDIQIQTCSDSYARQNGATRTQKTYKVKSGFETTQTKSGWENYLPSQTTRGFLGTERLFLGNPAGIAKVCHTGQTQNFSTFPAVELLQTSLLWGLQHTSSPGHSRGSPTPSLQQAQQSFPEKCQ